MLSKAQDDIPEDLGGGERFETPEAKTQKDGNKTVLRNFQDIADQVNRDPDHLSKFLLGELGTAGHVEGKTLVLNGSFRRGSINRKLEDYVETYVECPECGRPDTRIVKEKGIELLKCEACGARTPIDD